MIGRPRHSPYLLGTSAPFPFLLRNSITLWRFSIVDEIAGGGSLWRHEVLCMNNMTPGMDDALNAKDGGD